MMTLCGPTQSGKTFMIKQIIENVDEMIELAPTKLLYLYMCHQDIYNDIKAIIKRKKDFSSLKDYEFIDCNKGIPSIAQLKNKLGDKTLLVLDDLMVVAASNKENMENLNNIAARDSHHFNTSVIFVSKLELR